MQSYINVRLDNCTGKGWRGESVYRRRALNGVRSGGYDYDHNYESLPTRERVKYWLRKVTAFLFSQVGVGLLLMCYTILGATIFISVESPSDTGLLNEVERLRNGVVAQLWNVTYNYNVIHTDKWRGEVSLIVEHFQRAFVQQIHQGYNGETSDPWTFPKALMYSLSVYTTIGYGNLCPRTHWGKAITCLYALFGIPLLLLYMANIGDFLATSFRKFYNFLERCRDRVEKSRVDREGNGNISEGVIDQYLAGDQEMIPPEWDMLKDIEEDQVSGSNNEWKQRPNDVAIPISTILNVFFCYIVLGSVIFSWWEGWNYLDGSYFCFVSLVTIGFGDLVPGQTLGSENEQHVDGQLILCSIYILFGMSLMAMCFHLTQERFFLSAKKLGRALHLV